MNRMRPGQDVDSSASLGRDSPRLLGGIKAIANPTDLQVAITAGVEALKQRDAVTSDSTDRALLDQPGISVLQYAYPTHGQSVGVSPRDLVDKLNRTHPALHESGHVACLIRGEVIITDLADKRPSLPDDRYATVRHVATLSREDRSALLEDVDKARVAGRFGSWGALTAAWEAAEARKDARTILMCATAFTLFDAMRKDLKPVAAPEQEKAGSQKLQPQHPPPRSAPTQSAPAPPKQEPQQLLPKVQATMLKRLQGLDAKDRARLAEAPLPRMWRFEMTRYPVRQEDVVNLWRMFTRESIERFKTAGVDSPADTDDQMRFAAAYQALDGRQARSGAELLVLLKHTLVSPAHNAPAVRQPPTSASQPAAPEALPFKGLLTRVTSRTLPAESRAEPASETPLPFKGLLTRVNPRTAKAELRVGPASDTPSLPPEGLLTRVTSRTLTAESRAQQGPAKVARTEPVFPNQSPPKLSLSDKAIDQIMTRLKPEQVKELVGPASLVYGSSDPAAALAKAAETLRTTARDDPAREQAVNAVYAAALAVSIPDPRIAKLRGPDIYNVKKDEEQMEKAMVSPHPPKQSLLESIVKGAETRASDIPVTPSLTLDRVKRDYAQASLSAVLAQTKQAAAVNADAGDAQRLKKEAWVLAHAVLEAQARLPTDWNDLADDLLS